MCLYGLLEVTNSSQAWNNFWYQTEYQQNLKEASRDYIDLWLEHFTRQSNSFKIRTASSKEVFENWQEFIMENNIKCEYSSVQFMKKLSLMVVDGVKSTRTNGERKKQFDIEKLNQKYSLGCQLPKWQVTLDRSIWKRFVYNYI